MTEPGTARPGRPEHAETLRALLGSSRGLLRQARGRYSTDLLVAPYRDEFQRVWRTVDWVPGWFQEGSAGVLYGLIRDLRPGCVVEIGSYLGRSTVFFALSLRQVGTPGRVVAIDPHTGDRQQLEGLSAERLPSFDLFQQHLRVAGVEELVDVRLATSLEAARSWSGPIDLLFVDGWHSYPAVLEDGRAWLPHLTGAGVVVFDDYVAYPEVRQAVDQLASEGLFHLWGSVFGQAIGGTAPEPPPAARRALLLTGRGLARSLSARFRR